MCRMTSLYQRFYPSSVNVPQDLFTGTKSTLSRTAPGYKLFGISCNQIRWVALAWRVTNIHPSSQTITFIYNSTKIRLSSTKKKSLKFTCDVILRTVSEIRRQLDKLVSRCPRPFSSRTWLVGRRLKLLLPFCGNSTLFTVPDYSRAVFLGRSLFGVNSGFFWGL